MHIDESDGIAAVLGDALVAYEPVVAGTLSSPVKETLRYCSRLKGSSWALLMKVSFMTFGGTTFPSKMGPTCKFPCAEAVHIDSIKAVSINSKRFIVQD